MGKYLNQDSKGNILPALGKVRKLISDGATEISFDDLKPGDVAVVDNGIFEAALFVDERELKYLKSIYPEHEDRPVVFLHYPPAEKIIKASHE